jgi:exonuclease III
MMREKKEGILRIALQNPNGIRLSDMIEVLPEVVAMDELDIDIMALPETKLCQDGRTKEVLQRQLNVNVGSSLVIEASAPKLKDNLSNDYQPGGVMLAMTGKVIGRKLDHFRDPMGRFVWVKFRGSRGEGIIVIAAYRVCQKKGTVSGTSTAYTQQINMMLDEELAAFEEIASRDQRIPSSLRKQLDPRSRVLADLRKLISEERQRGFRPILCMDANEDWNDAKLGKELSRFLTETQLCDPLYDKFQDAGLAKSTYARGKRRIDFIFVDRAMVPAIKKIGTLGLHQAMVSDHVMVYADLDEEELFQGKINRPVRVPCREFLLAQADKCEAFIKAFKLKCDERNFRRRAESLYAEFQEQGARGK